MVALLLLLVGVGVGAWSQEVHRDTMVGNIWLEWIRKPTRLVPDTSPIRIVPLGGNDKVWMWPSKLSWLSSERLAVVHPLRSWGCRRAVRYSRPCTSRWAVLLFSS
ncbi:MAG: hypothetical protein KatS3mg039_0369 [Candidatus Kapaibacterium sp.]|nr:MAG: hypothetical protein KatS3mg039_0369 [Candidatus Kapabacteria bacterium]